MLALRASPVEDVPEFGALVLGVPLAELVAVREEAFLGACLLLVAPCAADGRVEAVLLDGVEQRGGLQLVAAGVVARLLAHLPCVNRFLNAAHYQARAESRHQLVAVGDGLGKVVAGVDVQKRKRDAGRIEGLARQMRHHYRVFAAREEDDRPLELLGHLAQDVDGLGLQLVEMRLFAIAHD